MYERYQKQEEKDKDSIAGVGMRRDTRGEEVRGRLIISFSKT